MTIEKQREYFKKWLDYRVECLKIVTKHKDFTLDWLNTITDVGTTNHYNAIHIYDIKKACDLLGIETYEYVERNDEDYPYEIYFMHDGVKFFGLAKDLEKEEKKNGK